MPFQSFLGLLVQPVGDGNTEHGVLLNLPNGPFHVAVKSSFPFNDTDLVASVGQLRKDMS